MIIIVISVIINGNFYHDHAAFSLTCQIELLILWIWFSAYCSCLLSLILSPLCELPVPFCFCRSPMQTYDTICTLNDVSCIFNCLLSHLLTLPSLWPNLSSEIITSSSRLLSFACILFFIIFFFTTCFISLSAHLLTWDGCRLQGCFLVCWRCSLEPSMFQSLDKAVRSVY